MHLGTTTSSCKAPTPPHRYRGDTTQHVQARPHSGAHPEEGRVLCTPLSSFGALTDNPFFLVLGASAAGFEADIAPAPPTDIPAPGANPWLVHAPAAPPATVVPLVSWAATAAAAAAAAVVLVTGFDAAGAAEASIPLLLSAYELVTSCS